MNCALFSTTVLSAALVSFVMALPTEAAAGDRSGRGASVSAGGVSVSASRGGASVSAGNTSVSADRGGASVSGGGASVSADRGGASVSGGGASVSADRGGASVSGDRGQSSATAERGDDDRGGGVDTSAPTVQSSRPVGDRSYGSIGEWFDDLRSSWFGGGSKRSDDMTTTTTSSSVTHTTQTSKSGGTNVNRVVQERSATAIGKDGGSANAEASNVNVTEQRD
jgi:hypothetical protein